MSFDIDYFGGLGLAAWREVVEAHANDRLVEKAELGVSKQCANGEGELLFFISFSIFFLFYWELWGW